jgi:CDP-diacylglycerol--glycerol-3-phosphate 3-phosphatidyltransferase/cardiolipin synthase
MKRDPLAALPNLLSLSRLLMAGLFVLFRSTNARLLLIAAAGATDFLDGYIARKRGSATKWGALIDAVADRFFVFAAICTLLFDDAVTNGEYALFMFRDFFTAVGFVGAKAIPVLRRVPFRSRPSGKVVTVLQLATLAFVYLEPRLVLPSLIVVGIVSVYSVTDYTIALWKERTIA